MNQKKTIDKKSIIIIEDHPVMRYGLAAWFNATGRWDVAGTAASLAEVKGLLAHIQANLVLLDIQLEDGWGLDIIPSLVAKQGSLVAQGSLAKPLMPLVAVYSAFNDYAHVSAALGMGVRAYITKRRSESELEEALLIALNGGIYIDAEAQVKLHNVTDLFSLLTKRETEILCLVKSGLSNKQIAARLCISRRTVENILSCVYDKTGIRTRLELERL